LSKDFEITIRVKNNRLLTKMRESGIESAAELARRVGCSQSAVLEVLRMSKPACGAYEPWRPVVAKIAEFLGCVPEAIIPPAVRNNPMARNSKTFTIDLPDVAALSNSLTTLAAPADTRLDAEEARASLSMTLLTLEPIQERVLRMRFGIGCEAGTLEEIGDKIGTSKEHVRIVEMQALKKLRHPARSRRLASQIGEPM
jgi:transcriptional regulator with XRE-family HTH domain